MKNAVAVMTPVQCPENIEFYPKLNSDYRDWNGIRAEIWPHVVPSGLNFTGCTDHLLTLCLKNQNDAKNYPDGVRPPDRHGEGEMNLAPLGHTFNWSLSAGRYLYLFIQPDFITKVAGEAFLSDTNQINLKGVCNFRNEPLHHICLALQNEIFTPGCGNKIYINSLATALALLLLRNYSSVTEYLNDPTFTTSGLLPWQWRRVTDHITTHLDGDLSLSELARITGVSVYHFARLFKEKSGFSPHQYVMQRRVDQAKQLLEDKQKNILEISLAVGFMNPAHFTTVFRKLVGMTPKAYRNISEKP